jgi:hypothetical protein
MTHLGSFEGYGRLILDPGNDIGVHYQIDVFRTEDGGILAGGGLTGGPLALSRAPDRSKAVLELSDGHRVDVVIVETSDGTARLDLRGPLQGF